MSGWESGAYALALLTGGPLTIRERPGTATGGGTPVATLDTARWRGPVDAADRAALDRCDGPTLDVGCGPGRLVAALARRGTPALGLDVSRTAVGLATSLGGAAIRRSVFDRVPGEGRWGAALLIDGNIGIGGDPVALLRRIAAVLAPGGRAVVECDPEERDERTVLDLGGMGVPWARLGASAVMAYALSCGFVITEHWRTTGRAFITATTGMAGAAPN